MRQLRNITAILRTILFLAIVAGANHAVVAPVPYAEDTHSYGPDGPWNYLTLNVGESPVSAVDFCPLLKLGEGDEGHLLITSNSCTGDLCLNPTPNYYDSNSDSAENPTLDRTVHTLDGIRNTQMYLDMMGSGYWSTAAIHNPILFNNTLSYVGLNVTQAQGKSRYKPLSLLSLEAFVTANKTRSIRGGNVAQNTMLEAFHEQYGGTQAFALHIGSSKFNQTGSLYLGGYDSNRLIERPAVFTKHGAQNLTSISVGLPDGQDPWTNSPQKPPSNLLSGKMAAFVSPQIPNMMLPSSVCQSLAQFLPVSYDEDSNLYLWNTSHPLYKELTSSSSYHLDFTWDDSAKTTIKVPFALLDLTLTKPIKDTPTAYFPCQQTTLTPNLGRAFLQAAVLMQSWNPDTVVIGQAPGPAINQTKDAVARVFDASKKMPAPENDAPKWEETWEQTLPAIKSTSSPPSAATSSPPFLNLEHVTPAGIAGIVVGCVGGALFVAGIIWYDVRRQSGKKPQGETEEESKAQLDNREEGIALKTYLDYAGVSPPRPQRPPSDLARLS